MKKRYFAAVFALCIGTALSAQNAADFTYTVINNGAATGRERIHPATAHGQGSEQQGRRAAFIGGLQRFSFVCRRQFSGFGQYAPQKVWAERGHTRV
jgi:hypothetical protein